MLPNLLIIGAAKCGTTSLHEYLDEHPQISMSRVKELDFFVPEKNGDRSVEWYASQFGDARVRGESSPSYTAHPAFPGVPERICALIPDVRMIYLVRDPIERIVSHYVHRVSTHPEMDGSLEEILEVRSERDWLLTLSRYWLQLERYFAHFPAEQILVVDSDELRDDRAETLRRIFRFLAVDDQFQSTAWDDVHNTAARPTRRTRLGQTVYAVVSGTVGRERAAALVARSPAALRDPFRRQVNRPIVSADVRTRLATELADDVERLREHTGLAFAGWSL